MRSLAIVLVAILASCGGKHSGASGRCGEAFAHLRSLGVFESGAAKTDALGFGMACKDLTDQDLACVKGAKTPEAVTKCNHAGVALLAVVVDLQHIGAMSGSAADAPADLADVVCACADDACLVQLGETRGDAIRRSGAGVDTQRLHACIEPKPETPVKKP